MCRMFAYFGASRDELLLLFRALRSSAESDPLAPNQTKNQHSDGWGYVLYAGGELGHEKFLEPIFAGGERSIPEFSGPAYAIFHARQAGSELVGESRFQHPFRGEWEGGTIFLAHNGSFAKRRLASELDPSFDASEVVGSEAALKYILQQRNKGARLTDATTRLEDFTKRNSALNLLILEVPRSGEPQLFAKHFYNRVQDGRDKSIYYQINYQKLDSGGVAFFSSTLAQAQRELKDSSILDTSELTPVSEIS